MIKMICYMPHGKVQVGISNREVYYRYKMGHETWDKK